MPFAAVVPSYNSLENPIGIETRSGNAVRGGGADIRYNSLENPIGIETGALERTSVDDSYNSLENPIGIETKRT